jgi:diguanylate cyclase (GGDEF)-like protein
MPDASPTVEARLKALCDEYASQLPEKIAQIAEAVAACFSGPWNAEACGALHLRVHNLVGSSGTYGYRALGDAARALDTSLKAFLDRESPPTFAEQAAIRNLVKRIERARLDGMTSTPASVDAAVQPSAQPSPRVRPEHQLVCLVSTDTQLADDLAGQIAHFGYTVKALLCLDSLSSAVAEAVPSAIIIDVGGPDGGLPCLDRLADIQRTRDTPIPALFISACDGLPARLQAVRAGASAYFTKPVDVDELIERLDPLTTTQAPDPFRVLIVDDSRELAAYLAGQLEAAGMATAIVTDPTEVMQPLIEMAPDLILMDLYMPGCSGLELAAVIRQQKEFISTPIVYLSAETDLDKQMEALRLGGDDFLTKPVQIGHLISSVTSRSQRSRLLRSLMVRDSLTGLLNHTATEERLTIEVARTQRQRGQLAYALIDLDYFKRVNDTYGHPIGDRVLTRLSRLLQQRLRQTDVIGRVGGEEFAVIFTDTNAAAAAAVLDEIRQRCRQVRHSAAGNDFYLTFSGGVAGYPAHGDPATLSEAADRALYHAKQQGRDRDALAMSEDPPVLPPPVGGRLEAELR